MTASITGTALGTIHGSCLPFITCLLYTSEETKAPETAEEPKAEEPKESAPVAEEKVCLLYTSVSAVYDLILKHRFYIVGALDLPIDYLSLIHIWQVVWDLQSP